MSLGNCQQPQLKNPKCTIQYSSRLLFYLAITLAATHHKFGAESFSRRNHFNQTRIDLRSFVLNPTNHESDNHFETFTTRDFSSLLKDSERNFTTMQNRYTDMMEDLRKELVETIPRGLLEASRNKKDNHTESQLDKATDFLDAHIGKKSWNRNLQKFVALKEASEGLKKAKSPPDFPQGMMEKLLEEEPELLEEMLLGDGAAEGNYAKAMEIYQEIYSESDAVNDPDYPVLHRLAVAIALEHATPIAQTNAVESPPDDIPEDVVDPVRRYLNYETAYMEGELDQNFDTLTTWELRYVVNGDEPDEIAAWGRKTMRNFCPDHVLEPNHNWLYAIIVRTNIPYGSSRVKDDDPKLQKYQNILRNGGICGRRAFFGRFILRSFGIPTTARPSKGHAALCHWRPNDSWQVNLGPGWGKGWTWTQYKKDVNFEEMTRARNHPELYKQVKMAQWIGDLFGENRVYGLHDENQKKINIGLWYHLSLKVQESILAKHKTIPPRKREGAPVDTIFAASKKEKSRGGSISCVVDGGKTNIHIPASSYSNKRKTKDVKIMKGVVNLEDEDANNLNEQIYLPPFAAKGTTIMRGGTWKNDATNGDCSRCTSGSRLLSGGYGRYENWGFRAAMTADDGEEDSAVGSCPEPQLTLELGDGSNSISMEFVYIPPGKFVMGGKNNKDGRFCVVELPHHPVEITKGFYIGKYPVTQEQYMALMKGKNPSKSTKHPKCPVDTINADDAFRFCETASEATGADIRLPTEAEWEYASRGTTNGTSADPQCFFGNDVSKLGDYAWYKDNANGKSHPVGLKKPNPFGLYDVYGNVCERISDTYLKNYYAQGKGGTMVDPTGPSQGTKSKFKYEIPNVPESGKYFLTARVCTVNVKQRLMVSTIDHNDEKGIIFKLPYTVGDWKDSEPIALELKKGTNTLYFWRDAPPQYGISIKEFVLTKA